MYSPKYGGSPQGAFPAQFPNQGIDATSMSITPIELLANDGSKSVVSHATGFFWQHNERKFLVTARHVVTGRDAFSNEIISKSGFIPEQIRFYSGFNSGETSGRLTVEFPLQVDGRPTWMQDVSFEKLRTDIAVIPLDGYQQKESVLTISQDETDIVTVVGFDCAIPGYPTTNYGGLFLPIWRRGSLASEPLLPLDDKPMFLVDSSTSPGFSGAPVLRRHVGPLPIRKQDGSIEVKVDSVLHTSLIGVYAGRLQHSHFGGEVAYAYYANRLSLIADQKS